MNYRRGVIHCLRGNQQKLVESSIRTIISRSGSVLFMFKVETYNRDNAASDGDHVHLYDVVIGVAVLL